MLCNVAGGGHDRCDLRGNVLSAQTTAKPNHPSEALEGVVANVLPEEGRLTIDRAEDGTSKDFLLGPDDRIFIDENSQPLRNLRPSDQVIITELATRGAILSPKFAAFRPDSNIDRGVIKEINVEKRQLTLATEGAQSKSLVVSVRDGLPIAINGRATLVGKQRLTLADLRPGDRAAVQYVRKETGREPAALSVERLVTARGTIGELDGGVIKVLDSDKSQFPLPPGPNNMPPVLVLGLAPACEIAMNDQPLLNNRPVTLADLQPGDQVVLLHDTRAVRIQSLSSGR